MFPEGQILAEPAEPPGAPPVGAIATLITPRTMDPLAPHTWYEATDRGRFSNHDPFGHTLYLADVYVDPAAWGKGVGAALYQELFALCRRLALARVVAGGRLWGYPEYAPSLTAE